MILIFVNAVLTPLMITSTWLNVRSYRRFRIAQTEQVMLLMRTRYVTALVAQRIERCDICGVAFADGQAACLRVFGEHVTVAHFICLPPLMDDDERD